MRDAETILATARDTPAFSNATQADIFMHNVCTGCAWYEDTAPDEPWDCPILDTTLLGKWPTELTGSGPNNCTARETRAQRNTRVERERLAYIDGLHDPLF